MRFKDIIGNSVFNLVGNVLPAVVGLTLIPFLLENFGEERFGSYTIVLSFLAIQPIFDLGISRVLTTLVSKESNPLKLKQVISANIFGSLCLGILFALVLIFNAKLIAINIFNLNDHLLQEMIYSIFLLGLSFPFTLIIFSTRAVLEGKSRFRDVNFFKVIVGTSNFLIPAILIFIGKDIEINYVLIFCFVRILIAGMQLLLIKSELTMLNFALFTENCKQVFSLGRWLTVSNVLSQLMVLSDRFIISSLLGMAALTMYSIPFDIGIKFLLIPGALSITLFPIFSKDLVGMEKSKLKTVYLYSLKGVAIFMSIIAIISIIIYKPVASIWISSEFADKTFIVFVLIIVGVIFNGSAQIPLNILQAKGEYKLTAVIHLIEFVSYYFILWILLKNFNIIGAAMAFSIRVIFDFLFLYLFAKKIIS